MSDIPKRPNNLPAATSLDAADVLIADGLTGLRKIAVSDFQTQLTEAVTGAPIILQWAMGDAYELTTINYDADGVVTTATVAWPDGSAGVFTVTSKNATFLAVDAFTVTHANSGKTVTQAAVTRDAQGNVTAAPALTIS